MALRNFLKISLFSMCVNQGYAANQNQIDIYNSKDCNGDADASIYPESWNTCQSNSIWSNLLSEDASIQSYSATCEIGVGVTLNLFNDNSCDTSATIETSSSAFHEGCCIPIGNHLSVRVITCTGKPTDCPYDTPKTNLDEICFTHDDCEGHFSYCGTSEGTKIPRRGQCKLCTSCSNFSNVNIPLISDVNDCPPRCNPQSDACFKKDAWCMHSKTCSEHSDCSIQQNERCAITNTNKDDRTYHTQLGTCQSCGNCTTYEDIWSLDTIDNMFHLDAMTKCPMYCNPKGPCFQQTLEDCICNNCMRTDVFLVLFLFLMVALIVATSCTYILIRRAVKHEKGYTSAKKAYSALVLASVSFFMFALSEKSKQYWEFTPVLPVTLGSLTAQITVFSIPILAMDTCSCCGETNYKGPSRKISWTKGHRTIFAGIWISYFCTIVITAVILVNGISIQDESKAGVYLLNGCFSSMSLLLMSLSIHFNSIYRARALRGLFDSSTKMSTVKPIESHELLDVRKHSSSSSSSMGSSNSVTTSGVLADQSIDHQLQTTNQQSQSTNQHSQRTSISHSPNHQISTRNEAIGRVDDWSSPNRKATPAVDAPVRPPRKKVVSLNRTSQPSKLIPLKPLHEKTTTTHHHHSVLHKNEPDNIAKKQQGSENSTMMTLSDDRHNYFNRPPPTNPQVNDKEPVLAIAIQ